MAERRMPRSIKGIAFKLQKGRYEDNHSNANFTQYDATPEEIIGLPLLFEHTPGYTIGRVERYNIEDRVEYDNLNIECSLDSALSDVDKERIMNVLDEPGAGFSIGIYSYKEELPIDEERGYSVRINKGFDHVALTANPAIPGTVLTKEFSRDSENKPDLICDLLASNPSSEFEYEYAMNDSTPRDDSLDKRMEPIIKEFSKIQKENGELRAKYAKEAEDRLKAEEAAIRDREATLAKQLEEFSKTKREQEEALEALRTTTTEEIDREKEALKKEREQLEFSKEEQEKAWKARRDEKKQRFVEKYNDDVYALFGKELAPMYIDKADEADKLKELKHLIESKRANAAAVPPSVPDSKLSSLLTPPNTPVEVFSQTSRDNPGAPSPYASEIQARLQRIKTPSHSYVPQ